MTTNDYNALRKYTDALRESEAAFSRSYLNEPASEKQQALFRDLLDKLTDLYEISDMVIDHETCRRQEKVRRRSVSGYPATLRHVPIV